MNSKDSQKISVFIANDSREYQHLYLRGNFQQEMFFDKVDMINVWNRIWLSAEATEVQILSVEILDNHFHITAIFRDDDQRTSFKRHLRLSITQYHNRRYKVQGTLGTRIFQHAVLRGLDDIRDCICYHIRNVLHHGAQVDYLNYPYSTGRYVFGLAGDKQKGIFTRHTMPQKLGTYIPARKELPLGWLMTVEGLIIPPETVFRADLIEAMFGSREEYLERLFHPTEREKMGREEPEPKVRNHANQSRKIRDEQVVEFVIEHFQISILAMNQAQKMAAIRKVLEVFPTVYLKQLSRIFGIPYTTLKYRIGVWRK